MRYKTTYRYLLTSLLLFLALFTGKQTITSAAEKDSSLYTKAMESYADFLEEYNTQDSHTFLTEYTVESVEFNLLYLNSDDIPELYVRYGVLSTSREFNYINCLYTYVNQQVTLLQGDYQDAEALTLYEHQNLLLCQEFNVTKSSSSNKDKLTSPVQYLTLRKNVLTPIKKETFVKKYPSFVENQAVDITKDLHPVTPESIKAICSSQVKLNEEFLLLPLDGYYSYLTYLKLLGGNLTTTWESSNPSIATVDSFGLVTAQSSGHCKITATFEGKSYSCTVVVPFIPDYESLAYLQTIDSTISYHEITVDMETMLPSYDNTQKFPESRVHTTLLEGVLFSDTIIEVLDERSTDGSYRLGTIDDLKQLQQNKKPVKIMMWHDLILSISEVTLP